MPGVPAHQGLVLRTRILKLGMNSRVKRGRIIRLNTHYGIVQARIVGHRIIDEGIDLTAKHLILSVQSSPRIVVERLMTYAGEVGIVDPIGPEAVRGEETGSGVDDNVSDVTHSDDFTIRYAPQRTVDTRAELAAAIE